MAAFFIVFFKMHSVSPFNYIYIMKKSIFRLLARINKAILPKYSNRDLKGLKKWEMAVVGYKYWVTINALG